MPIRGRPVLATAADLLDAVGRRMSIRRGSTSPPQAQDDADGSRHDDHGEEAITIDHGDMIQAEEAESQGDDAGRGRACRWRGLLHDLT